MSTERPRPTGRTKATKKGAGRRVKVLIALGALGWVLGGWAGLARADRVTAARTTQAVTQASTLPVPASRALLPAPASNTTPLFPPPAQQRRAVATTRSSQ